MRFGSHVLSLDYVQVEPCCACDVPGYSPPSLTSAFVKSYLYRLSVSSVFEVDDKAVYLEQTPELSTPFVAGGRLVRRNKIDGGESELFWFPQNDPGRSDLWPCRLKGYVQRVACLGSIVSKTAVVDESTLVRIAPTGCRLCSREDWWKNQSLGEIPSISFDRIDVKQAQNPSTIAEMTLKLRLLLSQPVSVGTTSDALVISRKKDKRCINRKRRIRLALRTQAQRKSLDELDEGTWEGSKSSQEVPFRDGSLLIHSPNHGAGKTLLLEVIAQELNAAVYKIQAGPLLAKYGVHSDIALQCTIHMIVADAAIRNQPVCVILDGLDAFLPLQSSNSLGDAANPVLQGILSYIQTLSKSVQLRQEVPFPSNIPLYNIMGKKGITLKVNFALVAIMTCPDKHVPKLPSCMSIYRLPNLTSETRLSSFLWAFERQQSALSLDAREKLPVLAASAVWARGDSFDRIAAMARARLLASKNDSPDGFIVPLNVVTDIFSQEGMSRNKSLRIQFDEGGVFDSVGGTGEAKAALEDALALDRRRRGLLESFGLSLPSGILLYGVPGCGKTLLAKAVARFLRYKGDRSDGIGGAFISLNSSDLVRSEVGAGEKMLVTAFEEARMNSPSVVFIDEFQAFFIERSSGGTARLSSTLLQCMDDVKRWRDVESEGDNSGDSNRVLVIAATNTPWMVDKAFLRPGRFDRSVLVELPNLQDRAAILSLHTKRMKSQLSTAEIEQLASQTVGFSGADLAALCRSAAVKCLVAGMDRVNKGHFTEVLDEGFVSSTEPSLINKVKKWVP